MSQVVRALRQRGGRLLLGEGLGPSPVPDLGIRHAGKRLAPFPSEQTALCVRPEFVEMPAQQLDQRWGRRDAPSLLLGSVLELPFVPPEAIV